METLGKGWSFPPNFDPDLGAPEMVSGLEDIRQSLKILFMTQRAERVMRPTYGHGLFAFEGTAQSQLDDVRARIEETVLSGEPRIVLDRVDIDERDIVEGTLYVTLIYRVPKVNARENLVLPFYLEEGRGLDLLRNQGDRSG